MANQNAGDRAYGLTCLCPIQNGAPRQNAEDATPEPSFAAGIRDRIQELEIHEKSPFAKVPNTYLCRLYVLHDVFYEGKPAVYEHLKSKYLVFSSNFHGTLEPYLRDMWNAISDEIKDIWKGCVAFDSVNSADAWIDYIKNCQVETTLFFNGSNDESLAEQLKALYLKQEFSDFVFENQGKSAEELQKAFGKFVKVTEPKNLAGPTWRAGASRLDDVVINNN